MSSFLPLRLLGIGWTVIACGAGDATKGSPSEDSGGDAAGRADSAAGQSGSTAEPDAARDGSAGIDSGRDRDALADGSSGSGGEASVDAVAIPDSSAGGGGLGGADGSVPDASTDADADATADVTAIDSSVDADSGAAGGSGTCAVDAAGSDSGASGPSCGGASGTTCGPGGTGDCCASSVVCGGSFYRTYPSTAYPATVSDFRLDDYEVTVGRFREPVAAYPGNKPAAGEGKNPNDATDPGWDAAWNTTMPADQTALIAAVKCSLAGYRTWTDVAGSSENLPINCASWYEAFAFCIWDGGRLPTEAEWQHAAGGGSEQRDYPWGVTTPGTDANLAVYGCYYNAAGSCSGVTNIAPVGSIPAGKGKFGQSDLGGNLREWLLDYEALPYATATCDDCSNFTPALNRIVRGGEFSIASTYMLTTNRDYGTLSTRYLGTGFRCARAP